MKLITFLKLWMLALSVTTFICIVISTAANEWVYLTVFKGSGKSMVSLTNSLWKECADDNGKGYLCRNVEMQPRWMLNVAWLRTVKGLVLSACVTSFIAAITTAVGFYKPKISCIATFLELMSGSLKTAGLAVFHKDNIWVEKYKFSYGWAFDIGVVGTVIATITFILGLFVTCYMEEKQTKKVHYHRHESVIQDVV